MEIIKQEDKLICKVRLESVNVVESVTAEITVK